MGKAGHRIPFRAKADVSVEPCPDVRVMVEINGAGTMALLKMDEWTPVVIEGVELKIGLTEIVRKCEITPTSNGKQKFYITDDRGNVCMENVRNEDTARSLFRKKNPGRRIISVSTD